MAESVGKMIVPSRPVSALAQATLFLHRRPLNSRFAGNQEPALADLLSDPTLHRLLASDGVQRDDLIELITEIKVKLRRAPPL